MDYDYAKIELDKILQYIRACSGPLPGSLLVAVRIAFVSSINGYSQYAGKKYIEISQCCSN